MILVHILFGVLIGLILFAAFLLMPTNGVYMFLFEHKEWRYLMKFSRNVEKFVYVGRYTDGKSHVFYWNDYKAIVWSGNGRLDGYAAVLSKDGEEVFCTTYWRSKSKEFADKLICKLPTK
jgi:hypothetical protein